jgi:hypothetical protein
MLPWVSQLLMIDKLLASGHGQRQEDQNLGLGWLYYALVRIYRPKTVVVIGSWRGFVPIVLSRACADNLEGGEVIFIDPSLVDDFWKDPATVRAHFATYGVRNIRHYCMTTQEFVKTNTYRDLGRVGLLFVDGYHTAEQASFDHEAFADKLVGPALFHDACSTTISKLYGEPYQHSVHLYLQNLRERGFSVSIIPLSMGVAIVTPPET